MTCLACSSSESINLLYSTSHVFAMAHEFITRATPMMILALILLLSPGAQARDRKCGTLASPLPLCEASKDACIAWCINEGYDTGVCYGGGGGGGGVACVCQSQCSSASEEEEAQAGGPARRGSKMPYVLFVA
ncbi:hypothetical protein ACP4OV_009771 [Aristida adscensionis]